MECEDGRERVEGAGEGITRSECVMKREEEEKRLRWREREVLCAAVVDAWG